MFILVYGYGRSDQLEEQWKAVVSQIGMDPPGDDAWDSLLKWRNWIIGMEAEEPNVFNAILTTVEQKIADTLKENALDQRRRSTQERRYSSLKPEVKARCQEIEEELQQVRQKQLDEPEKTAEENRKLRQTISKATSDLVAAELRQEADYISLILTEQGLQMEWNGHMENVPVSPPTSPSRRDKYGSYRRFQNFKDQYGKRPRSPSPSYSEEECTDHSEAESGKGNNGSYGHQKHEAVRPVKPSTSITQVPTLEEQKNRRPPSKNQRKMVTCSALVRPFFRSCPPSTGYGRESETYGDVPSSIKVS
jgi:hypothetical protein